MLERVLSALRDIATILLFLLGVLLIAVPIYIGASRSVSFTLGIFITFGFALIIFSSLVLFYIKRDVNEIIVKGDRYGIGRTGADAGEEVRELKDSIVEAVEESLQSLESIPDLSEEQIEQLASQPTPDPLQVVIDELSKQISIKEYQDTVSEERGLKIVDTEEDTIRAVSEQHMNLAEGLLFNVFVETDEINERVATAELTEPESTTGNLYEFAIRAWKHDEDEKIGHAKAQLENNGGRVKIITDGIVDVDQEELLATQENLLKMKNRRDMEYET